MLSPSTSYVLVLVAQLLLLCTGDHAGTCKTSMAQLQARTQDGLSLSVVAARHRPRHHHSIDSSKESPPGMRFLGAQAPGTRIHTKSSSHAKAQSVFGAVGEPAMHHCVKHRAIIYVLLHSLSACCLVGMEIAAEQDACILCLHKQDSQASCAIHGVTKPGAMFMWYC